MHWAHSSPAVSVFLTDADRRVLLARRAREPDAGLWDTLGGFLEEGEHPLDALRREVREESGLEVEPRGFVGAFMDTYGGGPDAVVVLNLVWEATASGGDAVPADDVSELRWFPPDALPPDGDVAFRWLAPQLRAWIRPSARRLKCTEGPESGPSARGGGGGSLERNPWKRTPS